MPAGLAPRGDRRGGRTLGGGAAIRDSAPDGRARRASARAQVAAPVGPAWAEQVAHAPAREWAAAAARARARSGSPPRRSRPGKLPGRAARARGPAPRPGRPPRASGRRRTPGVRPAPPHQLGDRRGRNPGQTGPEHGQRWTGAEDPKQRVRPLVADLGLDLEALERVGDATGDGAVPLGDERASARCEARSGRRRGALPRDRLGHLDAKHRLAAGAAQLRALGRHAIPIDAVARLTLRTASGHRQLPRQRVRARTGSRHFDSS
jgi:hypothetical protein